MIALNSREALDLTRPILLSQIPQISGATQHHFSHSPELGSVWGTNN